MSAGANHRDEKTKQLQMLSRCSKDQTKATPASLLPLSHPAFVWEAPRVRQRATANISGPPAGPTDACLPAGCRRCGGLVALTLRDTPALSLACKCWDLPPPIRRASPSGPRRRAWQNGGRPMMGEASALACLCDGQQVLGGFPEFRDLFQNPEQPPSPPPLTPRNCKYSRDMS